MEKVHLRGDSQARTCGPLLPYQYKLVVGQSGHPCYGAAQIAQVPCVNYELRCSWSFTLEATEAEAMERRKHSVVRPDGQKVKYFSSLTHSSFIATVSVRNRESMVSKDERSQMMQVGLLNTGIDREVKYDALLFANAFYCSSISFIVI
jgi:hypothetical protein